MLGPRNWSGCSKGEWVFTCVRQVAAKMEYHGDKEEDAEELTAEELSQWWSRAFMRPGCSLMASPGFSLSCSAYMCAP